MLLGGCWALALYRLAVGPGQEVDDAMEHAMEILNAGGRKATGGCLALAPYTKTGSRRCHGACDGSNHRWRQKGEGDNVGT